VRLVLADLEASNAFGARIAADLRAGDVVALAGELGAGKTTLARAIIGALGHRGEVPSPSFAILESYEGADMRVPVVHADFYRLGDPGELDELGLDELRDTMALIAEWPEQAGGFDDEPGCLGIRLEAAENGHVAIVTAGGDWQKRGRWT
jgi:tRNA threonylcarbamoyladenosine biosynthesis protein TsaE